MPLNILSAKIPAEFYCKRCNKLLCREHKEVTVQLIIPVMSLVIAFKVGVDNTPLLFRPEAQHAFLPIWFSNRCFIFSLQFLRFSSLNSTLFTHTSPPKYNQVIEAFRVKVKLEITALDNLSIFMKRVSSLSFQCIHFFSCVRYF